MTSGNSVADDTGKLALLLKILEESRKLKEEERKGNEVQLEILKVLSTTGATSAGIQQPTTSTPSMQSIPVLHPLSALQPSPSLEMLLGATTNKQFSEHHNQSAIGMSSGLGSLELLGGSGSLPPDLSSELSLTALLGQHLDLQTPILSNSGGAAFPSLHDFPLGSGLNDSSTDFVGSIDSMHRANSIPFNALNSLAPTFDPSSIPVTTGAGSLSMTALLDLESLMTVGAAQDSSTSPDIWGTPYGMSPVSANRRTSSGLSASPSPMNIIDGTLKKKALFSGDSDQTPISYPVISMVTPLVFAVEQEPIPEESLEDTPDNFKPPPPPPTARQPHGVPTLTAGASLPASPAEAFRFAAAHAAAQASSRRKTVEEACSCIQCGAPIGFLHLRGTQKVLETVMVVIDIRCRACSGSPGEESTGYSSNASLTGGDSKSTPSSTPALGNTTASSKNRKRSRENPAVECEVCRKHLGSGAVRAAEEGGGGEAAATVESKGVEVEVVCEPCGVAYLFCSECGGGGKSRTGKWRPKELFSQNRKTCSLPHVRIGNAEVLYRVLEVPKELSPSLVRGVKEVFFDCLLSLYAIPSIIDTPRFGGSFVKVRSEVDSLWTRTVQDAITNDLPTGLGGGKMYLTVAWIEKKHRNKGKGKNTPSKPPVPWLQKLALEGTVAPLKQEPTSPTMNDDMGVSAGGSGGESPLLAGIEKCYTAFAVFEWDKVHGSLFILQMAPRSIFSPSMESYGELIRRGVERVQADVRRDNAPPLEHLWCWTRAEEHSRLRVIPERLGFVPVEQYVRANPTVERNGFEREGYGPLKEEGVSIYATSVRDFLKLKFSQVSNKRR
ncbi:hypothetical protein HDU96_007254 [Phlyctochytrium bullatum]|nr:hypothetical protein HDU96_007254 [Phlyctochytrium bullatum]